MTAPNPAAASGTPAAGGTPTGQTPDGGQPQNTPAGAPQGPDAPTGTPAAATEPQDVDSLPAWAQKAIKEARDDAKKYRGNAQTATQQAAEAKAKQDAVLKALGLQPDGSKEPLTQEQLDAQIAQATEDVWTTKAENLVLKVPGVDADRLWDSRAFVASLEPFKGLDPRSQDFRDKVSAHITKYVEDHPQYKATPPGAARSGGDHPGGSGAPNQRPTSISAAVSNEYQRRGGR